MNRAKIIKNKKETKSVPQKNKKFKEKLFNKSKDKDKIKDKPENLKTINNKKTTKLAKEIKTKKNIDNKNNKSYNKKNDSRNNKIKEKNKSPIVEKIILENKNEKNKKKETKPKSSFKNKNIINSPKRIKTEKNINKETLSPNKKNLKVTINLPSPKKPKNASTEKIHFIDKIPTIVNKSKDTLTTKGDTLSPEKEKDKLEESDVYNNKVKTKFTPIPALIRKESKLIAGQAPNTKEIEKIINIRRQQYNEYLKSLHKPKPKPKPKPKVYDENSVIFIQKIFRRYRLRKIHFIITRLRINQCVTETLCLIFNNVFKHARRRITFYMLKTYYHDPFTKICNEVGFTDKIDMKLSDKYYNINNFIDKYS